MKLNSIYMENFKGITKLDLQLEGKTTIFFGINGVGKSTILRSIDLLYANIIWKITKSKKLADLEEDDISFGKSKALIRGNFDFDSQLYLPYNRSISRKDGRKHNQDNLIALVEEFERRYISSNYEDESGNWINIEDEKNMPIFVNYGVNRLVLDIPVRPSHNKQFTKLNAFDKAIESKIDFKQLFEWFRNQEDIENQEKVRTNVNHQDRSLKAVKSAMLAMLDGFENIRIERSPLAMKVNKDGKTLNIKQLSDGERCTIALFGDLARRLSMANPSLENPLEGVGVVLIDELDLHMHASWQRKVVRVLRDTFPNIQFIITTHSAQIIGEMGSDCNIYSLYRNDDNVECRKEISTYGLDSNSILEDILMTDHVSKEVKRLVSVMYEYIDERNYDKAEEIADTIDELTLNRNTDTPRARVLIGKGRRRNASDR